jgi:hypothetical protein
LRFLHALFFKLAEHLVNVNINTPEVGILDLPVVHLREILLALLFELANA